MSSKCQFWLSNNAGKDKMQLPVLPEQITITHDSQNESVFVAGLGEVTFIQDPTAEAYEWNSWFPAVAHQGMNIRKKKLKKPQEYVDKIEEWIASKKPIKFSITGTKIKTFCSIEKWNYYERGGDPGTLYYTITLKEYREIKVRKLDVKSGKIIGSGGGSDGGTKTGVVKTDGSRLMMYSKASTSSEIVKKIKNGSKVTITDQSGSWYAIEYDGKSGYAQTKYIKVSK